jgi:hypothetical protein
MNNINEELEEIIKINNIKIEDKYNNILKLIEEIKKEMDE